MQSLFLVAFVWYTLIQFWLFLLFKSTNDVYGDFNEKLNFEFLNISQNITNNQLKESVFNRFSLNSIVSIHVEDSNYIELTFDGEYIIEHTTSHSWKEYSYFGFHFR